MAEDKKENLWSVLWMIEFVVALFPAGLTLAAAGVSFGVLLTILPSLFADPNPAALKTFLRITVMFLGVLGLVAIGMAFNPNRLRRSPRLKMMAVPFGCAGILAEVLYVQSEKLANLNVFAQWMLLGPLVVGAHCAYRVFLQHET